MKGHGGFITAYSEQGKGAKLSVYIPAAESGEGALGHRRARRSRKAAAN